MADTSGANESMSEEVVDRDACMGSGNCVFWAPGIFDLDEDGVATVVGDLAAHQDVVRVAASHCPTSAIRLEGVFDTDA
jgi:ferredoxin